MSSVRDHAGAYLAMRRNLGYKLHKHGRLLMEFAGYLDDHGHRTITIDAATAWATAPASSTPAYLCQRLSVARCFARYLSTFDPACQVLPPGLLRSATSRPAPYLYPPEEIASLIHAAGTLANPLQAATHQALIGLLAVPGGSVRRSPWTQAMPAWTRGWSPSAASTTGPGWCRCTPPPS